MSRPASLRIRPEHFADVDEVQELHAIAFGRSLERDLLAELREDVGWLPRLSLVAELDGALVGHVCCTRAQIGGRPVALGLGPIGVLPERQKEGTGSILIHAVLAAADALDEGLVVLLGDPAFYSRMGFLAAHQLEVNAPRTQPGASTSKPGAWRDGPPKLIAEASRMRLRFAHSEPGWV